MKNLNLISLSLLMLLVLELSGCNSDSSNRCVPATPIDTTTSILALNIPKETPTYVPVNTPYTNKDLGFSLMYPTGWEMNKNEHLVIFSPSTQELDPKNVTDTTLWINAVHTHTTLRDLLTDFSSEAEIVHEGSISIASETWTTALITFDNENLGGKATATLCVIAKGNQSYILGAIAPAAEWNTQRSLFQEMVNSFRFDIPIVEERKAIPSSSPTLKPHSELSYKIVYTEDDFQVREAYLGTRETQDWDHFSMPEARIRNGDRDLGLDDVSDEKYSEWKKQWETTGWCTDTIKIITTDGTENKFTITKNYLGLGGHYLLRKNGILIWEKDLRAVTLGPIISSKQIGNEIAIDYVNVGTSEEKTVESILITQDKSVVDIVEVTNYDAAVEPNELQGKLTYFGQVYLPKRKVFLVFDGKEIAEYDFVFNRSCCWGLPDIAVSGNGEVIDFFAEKNGGLYHVQGGNLTSLQK